MRQAIRHIERETRGIGLVDITGEAIAAVAEAGVATGLATLFCRHTSASLIVQENADPNVLADIEAWFAKAVPEARGLYRHDEEGPDDPPSHIRTALTATSISIPIENGKLVLGTWQGIFLFEHRAGPRRRDVVVHVIGE